MCPVAMGLGEQVNRPQCIMALMMMMMAIIIITNYLKKRTQKSDKDIWRNKPDITLVEVT